MLLSIVLLVLIVGTIIIKGTLQSRKSLDDLVLGKVESRTVGLSTSKPL